MFVITAWAVIATASKTPVAAPPAFITAVSMTMIPVRAVIATASITGTAAELAM